MIIQVVRLNRMYPCTLARSKARPCRPASCCSILPRGCFTSSHKNPLTHREESAKDAEAEQLAKSSSPMVSEAAAKLTPLSQVVMGTWGIAMGGIVGCGLGAPVGSILGALSYGLGGFVVGTLLGGILGGAAGACYGLFLGVCHKQGLSQSSHAHGPAAKATGISSQVPRRFGEELVRILPLEQTLDRAFNRLPFRGRLLFFIFGLSLGSGGLSLIILRWRQEAASGVQISDQHVMPTPVDDPIIFSGPLWRWTLWSSSWWLPHWERVNAQVRPGLLLCPVAGSQLLGGVSTCSVAYSLDGVKVKPTSDGIEFTFPTGTTERFKGNPGDIQRWCDVLNGSAANTRRIVPVDHPLAWDAPMDRLRIIQLSKTSPEYKRVAKMAEDQQADSSAGQTYVQGNLKVTGVDRVQSPGIWDQYCLRRAIVATDNEGDPNEHLLWHGSPVLDIIIREGFDPRVCSLKGMFGAGVYFADKTTKSVRYCGNVKRGKLLLCRVTLGNAMLKRAPQPDLRRPPEPLPIFPTHFTSWLRGQRFHSIFAPASALLLMNEYVVYHTNQAYPEYIVHFVME